MRGVPALSIIVPVARGEQAWRALLPQLAPLADIAEVLLVSALEADTSVADAGGDPGTPAGRAAGVRPAAASDDTMALHREPPPGTQPRAASAVEDVRWLSAAAGRGRQQNAGALQARGALLWFLHADCRIDDRVVATVRGIDPAAYDALGWFRLRFHDGGPLHALNAAGATLRSRLFALPFGDQGLLLPARRFRALGGFDETLARGEDLDLVVRARDAGLPLRRLPGVVGTSARRYREHGWWRTTREHLALTCSLRHAARARLRADAR